MICQLRFPTILEIGATEPAAFQKKIRSIYPLYQRDDPSTVFPKKLARFLEGFSFPRTAELLTHKFLTEDGQRFISLTQEFVAVTEKQYRRWEDFRQQVYVAKQAVEESYQPAFYSRIGIRYQDVIDKTKLGLGSEPWISLIRAEFIGVLGASVAEFIGVLGASVAEFIGVLEASVIGDHVQQMRVEHLIQINEVQGGLLHLRMD